MDNKKITELTQEQMELINAGTGTAFIVEQKVCKGCGDKTDFLVYPRNKEVCTRCGWTNILY